jgi:hypothetical protein
MNQPTAALKVNDRRRNTFYPEYPRYRKWLCTPGFDRFYGAFSHRKPHHQPTMSIRGSNAEKA